MIVDLESAEKRRVLFVEDEPEILASIEDGPEELKPRWDMKFAKDGGDALSILNQDRIDIMVTSLQILEMDGAKLPAEARRHHPETAHVGPLETRLFFSPKQSLRSHFRMSRLCPLFLGRAAVYYGSLNEPAISPSRTKQIMAVKIRLKRGGSRNHPVYRIVVADSRSPRDGKFIEELGTYWPEQKTDNVKLDTERADFWIKRGAKPSDTVASFIKKAAKATAEAASAGSAEAAA